MTTSAPDLGDRASLFGPHGSIWGLLTVALTVCVGVNTFCWIWVSEVQYAFDLPLHARAALDQYRALLNGHWQVFFLNPHANHGPLSHLGGAVFMWLFGLSIRNLVLSSCIWLPVYAAAVFTIGRRLFDARAGFWAVLYLFSIPAFVDFSKQYTLEMGAHALVLVALAFLFTSDMLARRGPALLFGVSLAASLMTKSEMAAIWSLPLLVLGGQILMARFRDPMTRLYGLAALVVTGAIEVAWYAYAQKSLYAIMQSDRGFLAVMLLDVGGLVFLMRYLAYRYAREPAPDEAVRRFYNLLLVGSLLLAAFVPFALGRDLTWTFQERLRNASEGLLHGREWFNLSYYGGALVGRAFGALYGLLLVGGVCLLVGGRELRDARKCFLFGMFAWIFLLLNVASAKYEVYLFHVFGFSALLSTFWIYRWAGVRAALPTLLAVFAWLQMFGWLLLAPRVSDLTARDPNRLPPSVQQFDDLFSPERGDVAWYPVLPSSPVHARNALEPILQGLCEASGGPCDLIVGGTPTVFEVFNADLFSVFTQYSGLPVRIIALQSPTVYTERGRALPYDPRSPATIPTWFALQGDYPVRGSEQKAAACYAAMCGGTVTPRMELVGARRFRDAFNLLIYRVRLEEVQREGGQEGEVRANLVPTRAQ